MNHACHLGSIQAPALIRAAGDRAAYRFLEFSTAQIRNPHTRRAYVRVVGAFCAWLEAHGVPSIAAVGSIHAAAYVEEVGCRESASCRGPRKIGRGVITCSQGAWGHGDETTVG